MSKKITLIVASLALAISLLSPSSLFGAKINYDRDLSKIKEFITSGSIERHMHQSGNRFGVSEEMIEPLNSGMTLPTDFLFDGKGWEIVTSTGIFNINNNKNKIEKLNVNGVGLTDIVGVDKKAWVNSNSISINNTAIASKSHKFTPILPSGAVQAFEIIGDNKKSILISINGIPSVLSLSEYKLEKEYPQLTGYEVQHLSSKNNSSFLIAMMNGQWSLFKDNGSTLSHEAHLNTYANGLYAVDESQAIIGNRSELSLLRNGEIHKLISGFTHVMRIKKVNSDICILDSDDPLLICFNENELLDLGNKNPEFKVIAGNLFSYSSIVGVSTDSTSDSIFVATRPGRLWEKNIITGKQEVVAGNGGNAWIDINVPAIHSPIYYQTGIAFDGKYLYVAEQHGIYRLDTTDDIEKRRFELYAGDPKSYGDISDTDRMSARFLSIRDLSVTQDGEILVSDTGNHKIKKISHDGKVTTVAGGGINVDENKVGVNATSFSLKEPLSASSDGDGNIYIADSLDNVIVRVSPSGIVDKIIGDMMRIDYQGTGYGDHLFNTPSGVTVKDGNVFVTDSSSVKWVNIGSIDKKSCWKKISGSWYYPMNPIVINGNLYINNTGSNDVTLSSWSSTDDKCK
ncbi:TPA: hypothetical protein ACRRWE_001225 [Morganella morganii]